MCAKCKLLAMMEFPENPNPQEGRVYPKGWDLEGFYSTEAFGARVGYAEDDTLRMVYRDAGLCAYHMTIAQAFSGARMEIFYDGMFFCYRPAILKRGRTQPPAWHVPSDPDGDEDMPEEEEHRVRNAFENILREAGVDPREVFGSIEDDLPDDEA
jgi:hypothetical protein